MRLMFFSLPLLFLRALPLFGQDSLSDNDALNAGAFDNAVTAGAAADAKNKLEYLPGVFFVSEAVGYISPDDGADASDTRFYGKAFLKASKGDVGALYLGYNFNYFLYASAGNESYRTFYQAQSPDPSALSATLSEVHFSFDVKKRVFVRLGDQLISWGATYFWSPEDFINRQKAQASVLSVVDIRQGKPGVRIHLPLHSMNVFLFTDFSGAVKKGIVAGALSETIAQAWRIDATISGVHIGTVGYVTKRGPGRIGFDATGNLLGADLYGETALKFTNALNAAPDFALSVGGSRTLGQERNWTARTEFYFNEKGYRDTAQSHLPAGAFTPFYSGKYYAYGEISGTGLFASMFGVSLFGYANLADGSYSTTLQGNFDFPGVLPFSVYGRYYGGEKDREFTSAFGGRAMAFGVRISAEF